MMRTLFLKPTDIMGRLDVAQRGPKTNRGDDDLNPGMPHQGDLTPAAVLVPLIDHHDGLTMLLTQRTAHLSKHPGQISFPGGHCDQEDKTPEETALRETEEEVGIHRQHIQIIGRLSQYHTRTGFDISPIVAIVQPNFTLAPDPHEVDDVFEVPLSFLMILLLYLLLLVLLLCIEPL